MGALNEIRAGVPGQATLAIVQRAAGRAVRGFPPPEGYGEWSKEAVAEEVGELFERKPALLTKALTAGVENDERLEAYLVRVFDNALKDKAKSTDIGKLRRRFENVLGSDERFIRSEAAGETWVLAEFEGSVWSGDLAALRLAAAAVRGVFIEKLNPAGPTPVSVRDALRTIAAAVLGEARGAVLAQDLARVVFERFFASGQSVVYLDAPRGENIVDQRPRPEAGMLAESAARAVFANLDHKEKALLPHLGTTPEERLGLLEGVGPHEIEAIAEALRVKLAQAVVDDAEADKVVLALLGLCRDEP